MKCPVLLFSESLESYEILLRFCYYSYKTAKLPVYSIVTKVGKAFHKQPTLRKHENVNKTRGRNT